MDHEYDINNYIVDRRFMLHVHCETGGWSLEDTPQLYAVCESVDLLVENRCCTLS